MILHRPLKPSSSRSQRTSLGSWHPSEMIVTEVSFPMRKVSRFPMRKVSRRRLHTSFRTMNGTQIHLILRQRRFERSDPGAWGFPRKECSKTHEVYEDPGEQTPGVSGGSPPRDARHILPTARTMSGPPWPLVRTKLEMDNRTNTLLYNNVKLLIARFTHVLISWKRCIPIPLLQNTKCISKHNNLYVARTFMN
jgi:hypothetical protein